MKNLKYWLFDNCWTVSVLHACNNVKISKRRGSGEEREVECFPIFPFADDSPRSIHSSIHIFLDTLKYTHIPRYTQVYTYTLIYLDTLKYTHYLDIPRYTHVYTYTSIYIDTPRNTHIHETMHTNTLM